METKYLTQYENELNTCIRCAYCYSGCPVYEELGWEQDGARGKLVLAHGLLHGTIEPTEDVVRSLYQCTFCRDCLEQCSANVPIVDIIAAARADLYEAGFNYESHTALLDKIEQSDNIFGEELHQPEFLEEKQVLLGCRLLERTEDAEKYVQILQKLGIKPKTFDETCCAMPFAVIGDKPGFARQQEKFSSTLPDPEEELICACTTCAIFVDQKYPDIQAKYIIQVIAERLPKYKEKIKPLGIKVAYHDPCNLARGMGIVDEPRQVLEMIGVELVEFNTFGKKAKCCGGGGGLLVSDNPLAEKLSLNRVEEAMALDVDVLTTLCPTCEFNFKNAVKNNNLDLEVKNTLDLIAEALI